MFQYRFYIQCADYMTLCTGVSVVCRLAVFHITFCIILRYFLKKCFQLSAKVRLCNHSLYRNIINLFFAQCNSCTVHMAIFTYKRDTGSGTCFCFFKQCFASRQVCTGKKLLFQCIFLHCLRIKTAQQILKFQLSAQNKRFFRIKISQFRLLIGEIDRTVCTDRCQCLAHLCHIIVLSHGFSGSVWFQFLQMLMSIFNASVFHYDLRGSLFTHARNSRNIIGTVSH